MSTKVFSSFDMQGSTVTGLATPSASSDAATKAYVDSAVEGLNWKDSVRAASVANVNVSSAPTTLDGVTLATNDRVLLKDQSTASQNGVYIFNGGSAALTRAADCDTAAELEQACIVVEEGTSNAGTTWRQTLVNFTLGSGSIAFTAFGTAAGSASESSQGIIEIATQAEVDAGSDTVRAIPPAYLAAWSGRKLKATGNIGDGSATQIDVTHNFGTRALQVELFRNSTPWDTVLADTSRPDTNTVRFNFATAPTSNQFTYMILG